MMVAALSLALLSQIPGQVNASSVAAESPRTFVLELKLGPYKPLIDNAVFPNLGPMDQRPYARVFGDTPMLMGEVGLEYMIWQRFGTISAGLSVAYAEKFGKAVDAETGLKAEQSTGLRILTVRPGASYRFDYLALKYKIPLVPYVKGQFVTMPWWVVNGGALEYADGRPGEGVAFGLAGTVGLSLMLDILDQRLARDFDSSVGVNHTYLFAEFNLQEMFRSSAVPLLLSSRHWLFGIAFDL
ncbi:MAG: hypothetical protein JNJ54_03065 [Myxococcaceae bacterium]|nr:hypothetical protein [Myxococcaceae bacterium]